GSSAPAAPMPGGERRTDSASAGENSATFLQRAQRLPVTTAGSATKKLHIKNETPRRSPPLVWRQVQTCIGLQRPSTSTGRLPESAPALRSSDAPAIRGKS